MTFNGIRHMNAATLLMPSWNDRSRAVRVDSSLCDLLFLSGVVGNNPDIDSGLVAKDLDLQVKRALFDVLRIIKEAGGDHSSFVSITAFIKDVHLDNLITEMIDDELATYGGGQEKSGALASSRRWQEQRFRSAYGDWFNIFYRDGDSNLPALTVVWVAKITAGCAADDALVMLQVTAVVPKSPVIFPVKPVVVVADSNKSAPSSFDEKDA